MAMEFEAELDRRRGLFVISHWNFVSGRTRDVNASRLAAGTFFVSGSG